MSTTKNNQIPNILAGMSVSDSGSLESLTMDELEAVDRLPALKQLYKGYDKNTKEDMRAVMTTLLTFAQLVPEVSLDSFEFPYLVKADKEMGSKDGVNTVLEFVPSLRPFHNKGEWQRDYHFGAATAFAAIINWYLDNTTTDNLLQMPKPQLDLKDVIELAPEPPTPLQIVSTPSETGDPLKVLCRLTELGVLYKLFEGQDSYQVLVSLPGTVHDSMVDYDWQEVTRLCEDLQGLGFPLQMRVINNIINIHISL